MANDPSNIIKIKNNNLEEGIEYFSNWLSINEQGTFIENGKKKEVMDELRL